MDFTVKNLKENVVGVARKIGYTIIDTNANRQYNLVRRLTGQNYPRFHIYLKHQGNNYIFNLHLDQKKPSYEGSHAHSGEYFGPVVDKEIGRIKDALKDI